MNEYQMHHYQDCWSILYMKLGRSLLDVFGVEGESILREAVRRYGRDRGSALRERHLACGLKPNLYNMFNYYDLPLNTQYRQNKVRSTETERLTHTRSCPIADLWKAGGELALGRMYCEEFHHAMFGAYNCHIQINLAQTLTMEGIDYCCFATYLRPANMTAEERKATFSEFDPDYRLPSDFRFDMGMDEKGQMNILLVKLYYHMFKTAVEKKQQSGAQAVAAGLRKAAEAMSAYLMEKAESMNLAYGLGYVRDNCPLQLNMDEDRYWQDCSDENVKEMLRQEFYPVFLEGLK